MRLYAIEFQAAGRAEEAAKASKLAEKYRQRQETEIQKAEVARLEEERHGSDF